MPKFLSGFRNGHLIEMILMRLISYSCIAFDIGCYGLKCGLNDALTSKRAKSMTHPKLSYLQALTSLLGTLVTAGLDPSHSERTHYNGGPWRPWALTNSARAPVLFCGLPLLLCVRYTADLVRLITALVVTHMRIMVRVIQLSTHVMYRRVCRILEPPFRKYRYGCREIGFG